MKKKKLMRIALVSFCILLFISIIALGSSGKKSTQKAPDITEDHSDIYASPAEESQIPEPASIQPHTPDNISSPETYQDYSPEDVKEDQITSDYAAPSELTPPVSGSMEVHFMDVGQGDATLIVCEGEAMLIDAGDDSKGTAVQYYLTQHGVDSLKYLVLTHPDADHIGGADVIVTKFDIGTVFESYYKKPDYHKTSDELAKALSYRYMNPVIPTAGSSYNLGGAAFTFVGPIGYSEEPNNASLALVLQYGSIRFLFTGDAEFEEESAILNSGYDIKADVYKAGHHGSRTSSNDFFLRAVMPDYAVISCGINDYGHPHNEALQRLYNVGAEIFRTDQSGNIIASTDGSTITWNTFQSGSGSYGNNSYNNDSYVNDSYGNNSYENDSYENSSYGYDSYGNNAVAENDTPDTGSEKKWYYAVTTSGYFHQSPCEKIRDGENPQTHYWIETTRDELIDMGLRPCHYCNP